MNTRFLYLITGSSQSVSIYRWEIEAKISVSVSISRFLRLRPLLYFSVPRHTAAGGAHAGHIRVCDPPAAPRLGSVPRRGLGPATLAEVRFGIPVSAFGGDVNDADTPEKTLSEIIPSEAVVQLAAREATNDGLANHHPIGTSTTRVYSTRMRSGSWYDGDHGIGSPISPRPSHSAPG